AGELAFGSFHLHPLAVHLDADTLRDRQRSLTDSRHAPLLPQHGDQLAADVRAPRVAVRHQPLWRRENRHAQAVLDPGDLAGLDVAPEARRGHAAQLTDHRGLTVML